MMPHLGAAGLALCLLAGCAGAYALPLGGERAEHPAPAVRRPSIDRPAARLRALEEACRAGLHDLRPNLRDIEDELSRAQCDLQNDAGALHIACLDDSFALGDDELPSGAQHIAGLIRRLAGSADLDIVVVGSVDDHPFAPSPHSECVRLNTPENAGHRERNLVLSWCRARTLAQHLRSEGFSTVSEVGAGLGWLRANSGHCSRPRECRQARRLDVVVSLRPHRTPVRARCNRSVERAANLLVCLEDCDETGAALPYSFARAHVVVEVPPLPSGIGCAVGDAATRESCDGLLGERGALGLAIERAWRAPAL